METKNEKKLLLLKVLTLLARYINPIIYVMFSILYFVVYAALFV